MTRRVPSRITVFDVALIVVVLLSGALVLRRLWQGSVENAAADVYLNGRLEEIRPLDRDGIFRLDEAGMTLEVRNSRIRVADSDCPKHTCARMGWISRPGQTIVCAPNRLLVQIRGGQDGIDAVTY